uniref:Uncharacterized protein n=1 Tax=Pristionchus pacificus TaxID=54126 RepID=A0A2A6D1S6_PRIPA|eukprot:PDM84247.1 hypothetical protein PRIPAC_33270 [Pristionchus pacificus]
MKEEGDAQDLGGFQGILEKLLIRNSETLLSGISGPPTPFVRTGATSSSESLSQSARRPPFRSPLSLSSKVASKQLSEVCLRNEAIHEEAEDREPRIVTFRHTGNGVREQASGDGVITGGRVPGMRSCAQNAMDKRRSLLRVDLEDWQETYVAASMASPQIGVMRGACVDNET